MTEPSIEPRASALEASVHPMRHSYLIYLPISMATIVFSCRIDLIVVHYHQVALIKRQDGFERYHETPSLEIGSLYG